MGSDFNIKQMIKKPSVKIASISASLIILLTLFFGIADAALYAEKVHRGVKISGIPVGGKEKIEVLVELERLADEIENKPVTIHYKSKTWLISAKKLNAGIDYEKTFDKAFNIGKKGKTTELFKERIGLWFKARNIFPEFRYDKEKLNNYIKEISKDVNQLAEDSTIKIVDNRAVIKSSKEGLEVDEHTLVTRLFKSFPSSNISNITLPVNVVEPDINEDSLSETKDTVNQIIKGPITLQYRDKKWQVEEDKIAGWIDFKKERNGNSWVLVVDLNKDEVKTYLDKLTKELVVEPKNAEFTVKDDKVIIIPGSTGQKVDLENAYGDIIKACETSDTRSVMLTTTTVEPDLTTEDAQKMGIKEKVSSYQTFFNPKQTSRVHNIQLLASELDSNIVAPGEVFSFNGTIGPRTAKKGYREAPAIINGELVPSLGGGVCQVATTLFNTVFFGGFEVIERHNHSFFISHYPTGRDATVSYNGPDLKFKNNTSSYVLIKTYTTGSAITISFFSTKQDITVKYTTSGPTNFKAAKIVYEDDPTLPKGTTKVFDKGISGRDVSVSRTIVKNGKVVKTDKFFSRYSPKKSTVKVGTSTEPQDKQSNSEGTNVNPGENSTVPVTQPNQDGADDGGADSPPIPQ